MQNNQGEPLRVAIVHDYLTQRGGAERVALSMARAFPGAPLYTTMYLPDATFPEFSTLDVRTTPLQRIPVLTRAHTWALPFLPAAIGSIDVGDVDVVVVSSSGWAHGIRASAPVVVYCHTPPRWLYEPADYRRGLHLPGRAALGVAASALRRWDQRAARRAKMYVANSTAVQARIRTAYGVESVIVPPPVNLGNLYDQEALPAIMPGYFLVISRRRGYKNVRIVTDAFAHLPEERLVVVGGTEGHLTSNVTSVEDVSDAQLRWLYANSQALISMSNEDFGLTPLEANLFGVPAIVVQAGGFLDTLEDGLNGIFVSRPQPGALVDSVKRFLGCTWDQDLIRNHAEGFGEQVFADRLADVVRQAAGRPAPVRS